MADVQYSDVGWMDIDRRKERCWPCLCLTWTNVKAWLLQRPWTGCQWQTIKEEMARILLLNSEILSYFILIHERICWRECSSPFGVLHNQPVLISSSRTGCSFSISSSEKSNTFVISFTLLKGISRSVYLTNPSVYQPTCLPDLFSFRLERYAGICRDMQESAEISAPPQKWCMIFITSRAAPYFYTWLICPLFI